MLAEPTRLYDYTYIHWYTLAHRTRPDWSEAEMDASWDQHIQFPVRTSTEVKHGTA
jgi:hypothetical protein